MAEDAPSASPPPGSPISQRQFATTLIALIAGQIGLHACMAGVRLAAPLLALGKGHSPLAVGVLMALFAAAPIALALPAGRLADRHGYHRPMHLAVMLTAAGGAVALFATWLGAMQFPVLCLASVLTGAGANIGLIAIQRTAGRTARDNTERKRVFSWLGVAPSLSNLVGPVMAGVLIDAAGFSVAFAALMLLPLASLWWARRVPVEVPVQAARSPTRTAWKLTLVPGMRRLLLVNWLISTSWDLHAFVLPILGHERGFSASAIGVMLGAFAFAVTAVRLVIPFIAHRTSESQVLCGAMLWVAAVFAVYPFARSAWLMGSCAVLLGLALGTVQPMIMATLHHITPYERHGEAIALRSMAINFSSATMPLLFGLAGAALGAATLFWAMSAAMAAGSWPARRIGGPPPAEPIRT